MCFWNSKSGHRMKLVWCGLFLSALTCCALQAQEAERKAFDESLVEWRQTYIEVIEVFNEFKICEEYEADALRERYRELKAKGEVQKTRTIELATDVLMASPNADRDVLDFLGGLPDELYKRYQYELAARVGKALLKHNFNDQQLRFTTILATFFSNEFSDSKKLFEEYIQQSGSVPSSLEGMYGVLDETMAHWDEEQKLRNAENESGHLPRVAFELTTGTVVVELFEDSAPTIVNNLIVLVESEEAYFENMPFYFVMANQLSITGCRRGNGTSFLPLGIMDEVTQKNKRHHFRGALSLGIDPSRGGTAITNCQFVKVPIAEMDSTNLVVGRVVEGLEYIDRLNLTHELNEFLEPQPVEQPIRDLVIRAYMVRKPDGKDYNLIRFGQPAAQAGDPPADNSPENEQDN